MNTFVAFGASVEDEDNNTLSNSYIEQITSERCLLDKSNPLVNLLYESRKDIGEEIPEHNLTITRAKSLFQLQNSNTHIPRFWQLYL
eukprot:UN24536